MGYIMLNETELRTLPTITEVEHRFWSKVSIIDDDTSCWLWMRATTPDGYGHFTWKGGPFSNHTIGAHRVALFLTTGVLAAVTCHTCDNPPCVRPSHLYDGTHQTNGADKATRGRGSRRFGDSNHAAKLTEEQVVEIRELAAAGATTKFLAEMVGMHPNYVGLILRGLSWPEAGGPLRVAHSTRSPLTQDQVREIKHLLVTKAVSQKEIARRFGVDPATITNIKKGKTWSHLQ